METLAWFGWAEATMRYNETWIAGWITQPANSWSNLAYIIVGIALFGSAQGRRGPQDSRLLLPIAAILVGITSFLYHASSTFFFQVSDLASMYILSSYLVADALKRSGGISRQGFPAALLALFAASVAALLLVRGKSGAVIFAAQILAAIAVEIGIYRKSAAKSHYIDYGLALAMCALAFVFWIVDYRGLFFDPENHFIQGHAIWHVVNSSCYVFLFRFAAARDQAPERGEKIAPPAESP